jgi:hypothetical protein
MDAQTIIVGGGMAGMSCALRLKAYNRPFTLITDRLGGRVLYEPERKENYGALFVMQNYHYAKKILKREKWINTTKVMFHHSRSRRFATLSQETIASLPSLVRFVKELLVFFPHYERFKRNCLRMPIQEALKLDPFMQELFNKPAADFVAEKNLGKAVDSFVGKFIYACTLTSYDKISTLDFLNVSLGLVLPVHLFSFDENRMKNILKKELVLDTAVSVTRQDQAYEIKTRSGNTYKAAQVVLATPAAVTSELLGIPAIRGVSRCYTFHIKGRPKAIYAEKMWNLFSSDYTASALVVNWDGTYMLYTRTPDANLDEYFDSHELIGRYDWDRAMYVHGREFLAERYDDRLLIAGDHNGLGLEPASVSGIHAANQIIMNT